jgi:cardiolipin synthase
VHTGNENRPELSMAFDQSGLFGEALCYIHYVMLNVPNAITLARLILVPVMAYFLTVGAYSVALIVFLAAAVTDLIDGFIARIFRLTSTLGATLDPIADKLNMFVATVLLAWQGLIPIWLAIAIVARDIVIVGGVLAYRLALGHVEMAPTMLSKVNTFIEFTALLLVMATAAEVIDIGTWLSTVFLLVLATVLASGAQYVWIWGRKAALESRRMS